MGSGLERVAAINIVRPGARKAVEAALELAEIVIPIGNVHLKILEDVYASACADCPGELVSGAGLVFGGIVATDAVCPNLVVSKADPTCQVRMPVARFGTKDPIKLEVAIDHGYQRHRRLGVVQAAIAVGAAAAVDFGDFPSCCEGHDVKRDISPEHRVELPPETTA